MKHLENLARRSKISLHEEHQTSSVFIDSILLTSQIGDVEKTLRCYASVQNYFRNPAEPQSKWIGPNIFLTKTNFEGLSYKIETDSNSPRGSPDRRFQALPPTLSLTESTRSRAKKARKLARGENPDG